MRMQKLSSKKRKTAIITFHAAYNFGAVLQAYALQEFIGQNFGEVRIIDYHSLEIDRSYVKPNFVDFKRNPKQSVFRWLQCILYKGKNVRIDAFRQRYLRLTKRYDLNNIKEANAEADVFIAGSDQVWNYMIIGNDTTFFLDFIQPDKRTCSFAASIAVKEIPKEFAPSYKAALMHIQKLSVRETSGIRALEKIGIRGAEIMPDPTILLLKEHWEELCIEPGIKGKYILVYKITKADKLIFFARKLSKKTGLRIVFIPNDLKDGIVGSLKLNVGPQEWMGYIKNAEYIVTNSFHGTVFSILFGKKFFSEVSERVNPSMDRLLTLLVFFGLENRTIDRYRDEMLNEELQDERIRELCERQRLRAYHYFESVFGEGEQA